MKKIISVAILFVASTIPSYAQFGGGIVFDPKNFNDAIQRHAEQIKQAQQLIQQLHQLQQMYALYQQQYNLLNAEAQSIKLKVSRPATVLILLIGSSSLPATNTATPTPGPVASAPAMPVPFSQAFAVWYPRFSRQT